MARWPLTGGVSIALAVTLGHLINDAYGAMLTPLAPALRGQYHVSIAAVTLLASVFSLTSSVLQPLLGVIGDRLDRRVMAAAGPALTGLGLTLMGYAPTFGLLTLLVALAGFGSGFFHPAGAAYTALHSPRHQRGLWASIFSAGGTAGSALGPVFAGVGLHQLPIFGVLGLLVGAVSYVITPADKPAGPRPSMLEYLGIFRGPIVRLWGMAVLRSLAGMGYTTMLPFILLGRGYGTRATALTLAVFAVASAVGGLLGGRLSDTLGRVPILRAASVVPLPLFAAVLFSTPDQWWFYPLTFIAAALINASIPVGVVTAQEYAPRHVAVASSIMMGFSWGFAGILVFLVGVLADQTSPVVAALASLGLLLPAALLAATLPEPERPQLS
ncbi:MFS transporter [Deinococcus sonorensis]|uniref:MFS transporter n=2 Tax=Deinococcus sonorensis TaxID=309891 RepID=A0AAU7U605_9DEIO